MLITTEPDTSCSYMCGLSMSIFYDANVLYEAGSKAMKGSRFKRQTQLFEMNHLLETAKLQSALLDGSYQPQPGTKFRITEQGKARDITSNVMTDKTINHVICDQVLGPAIAPLVIYDNSASQVGKGVSFHRKRFVQALRRYYNRHHTNEGYILFVDFSKYYASIPHKPCLEMIGKILDRMADPEDAEMTKEILQKIFRIFGGEKGIDIGNQCSQDIGVIYPHRIDNYAKIVRGAEAYGRYTDDFYLISPDKAELLSILDGIRKIASDLGLIINERKTHICRLSDRYRHLQIQYSLTSSGRVIQKISPKSITRERRKLKAYKRQLDSGRITMDTIEGCFRSWLGGNWRVMSRQQIINMSSLYRELFGKELTWEKIPGRLHWLMAAQSKTSK